MPQIVIDIADDHPMREAVGLANQEFRMGFEAAAGGNLGRVRVCARRAVAAFVQQIAPMLREQAGTNAMANLRWVEDSEALPSEQRRAAGRLSGGARAERAGSAISHDPLADAALIINYFVGSASV